jgi:hypothetical protein
MLISFSFHTMHFRGQWHPIMQRYRNGETCQAHRIPAFVQNSIFTYTYIHTHTHTHTQYGISSPSGEIFIHENDIPYQDSDMQKISNKSWNPKWCKDTPTCRIFSFGYFPGVWIKWVDVSETSVGSIFLDASLKRKYSTSTTWRKP